MMKWLASASRVNWRLVAAGHDPHDLEGRRAPGPVEIDERAVLVEQDALEGSWLERAGP